MLDPLQVFSLCSAVLQALYLRWHATAASRIGCPALVEGTGERMRSAQMTHLDAAATVCTSCPSRRA
eukprot:355239-Chlamydomonas_euryale.AAC.2